MASPTEGAPVAGVATPFAAGAGSGTAGSDFAHLVEALERSGIGTWSMDVRSLRARVSPFVIQLLGEGSPDENWSFDRLEQHVVPEDRQRVAESLGSALASGGTWRVECRIRFHGSATRWIRIEGSSGGEGVPPTRLMGIVQDVTDLREATEALRRSEEASRQHAGELQALLDAVPAAVWIARDPRGDRIDANRYGAEVLRERPGRNLSITAPGADASLGFQVLVEGRPATGAGLPIQRAAGGEVVRDAEIEIAFDDGEVRRMLGNAVPLRDANGHPTGAVGAFVDVPDRVRAERALQQAGRLRELGAHADAAREAEKKRIAAELHDEMGQVLTALRYNVEALEEGLQAQPPGAFVDRMLPRAQEGVRLVSQAAASLQRVVSELRPAALDVLGICPALLDLGRRFAGRSDVRCSVVVPDRPAGYGTDVDTALFRVAQESLTNVARHSGARHVSLSLEHEDDEVVLRVEDDGRGLPPDVEASFSFGLSSMRERVERLGGSLHLGRGQGGGTTVEARVPAFAVVRLRT
jgi:signal transduction histidine kinase